MRLSDHIESPLQDLADPILTKSIYRSGALDEVIHRVIAPFWDRVGRNDPLDVGS